MTLAVLSHRQRYFSLQQVAVNTHSQLSKVWRTRVLSPQCDICLICFQASENITDRERNEYKTQALGESTPQTVLWMRHSHCLPGIPAGVVTYTRSPLSGSSSFIGWEKRTHTFLHLTENLQAVDGLWEGSIRFCFCFCFFPSSDVPTDQ